MKSIVQYSYSIFILYTLYNLLVRVFIPLNICTPSPLPIEERTFLKGSMRLNPGFPYDLQFSPWISKGVFNFCLVFPQGSSILNLNFNSISTNFEDLECMKHPAISFRVTQENWNIQRGKRGWSSLIGENWVWLLNGEAHQGWIQHFSKEGAPIISIQKFFKGALYAKNRNFSYWNLSFE